MKRSFILILIAVGWIPMEGQVGIGTTLPDASSILDIGANDKGILIPRVSLNNILDNQLDGMNLSAESLLIYNTNASVLGGNGVGFYYFDGAQWKRLALTTELDDDWTDVGTDIERQSGDVYIGNTNGTNSDLYISNRLIDWDDPNYFVDPAANNKLNEVEFDDGSASDPSIRFDDTTTGFFSPATDVIAYSVNSAEKLRIDVNGRLGINTVSPAARLDVADTFKLGANGNAHRGMFSLSWDFGMISIPANSSLTQSIPGTSSIYNIPQQTSVSMVMEADLGPYIIIQQLWMESDALQLRLLNMDSNPVSIQLFANFLFVWK
jgi:hypothetical protein